jgi:hypothetical protein
MDTAHVIAGCDTETVEKLYFSKESALIGLADHAFVAFFDASGTKIGEVRIEDINDCTEIEFEDEF